MLFNCLRGTFNLFGVSLRKLGIDVTFFNPNLTADEITALANDNTKLIYAESLGNPAMNVLNFKEFSAAAKELEVPFIVDNTLATPYLCQAFEHGANIIVHSTTKYIDGHASSLGGIVIDGGNFDWTNGKYPELVEPDPLSRCKLRSKLWCSSVYCESTCSDIKRLWKLYESIQCIY